MKTYCLGYAHEKCRTCLHEMNWQTLNQMPDALRKPIQSHAQMVDDDRCRRTGMGSYKAAPETKP